MTLKILPILILSSLVIHAATFYCGPTSAGGNTGADFGNRIALPDTTGFNRGDTYVTIGSGTSYGSRTLSEATSGTTTITIRKANAAQDSGVAGWSAAFETAQATFTTISVATRYWILDGVSRTESDGWSAPTDYGFRADQIYANSNDGHDADFSQFRYMDLGGAYAVNPSDPVIDGYSEAVYIVFNQADLTFSYCALHNGKPALMQAAGAVRITVEYCDFGPGWGKEAIRGGNGEADGWIIRYNRFWNSSQKDPNDPTSGTTAEIAFFGNDSLTYSDNAIYGNSFFNVESDFRNAVIAIGGQGFSDTAVGTLIYNNTLANVQGESSLALIYTSGTGNIVRNTLFYGNEDSGVTANTESNNDTSVSDIFVDYANMNFRLTEETDPGFTLSSPYDEDPDGNERGSSGTWSVGAFQFDGTPPPSGGAPNAYGHTARVGSIRAP